MGMTQYLLNSMLVIVLFGVTGCKEPAKDTVQLQSGNTVSGTLNLYLNRRDSIGLYVCFELKQHAKDGTVTSVAQSGCKRISEHPIQFSLAYPVDSIKQQNEYKLITTVAEDPQGNVEITAMSSSVLTQGHPSVLNMAIQTAHEPIE